MCITDVEALDDDELAALMDCDSDSDGVAPCAEVAMPFKAIEVPTVETTNENEKCLRSGKFKTYRWRKSSYGGSTMPWLRTKHCSSTPVPS